MPKKPSKPRTEEERLEKHRESVRKGAAAHKAAVKRLIAAHSDEFTAYLIEEKQKAGIKSWDERKRERRERELLAMLADPHLAELARRQAS